jgi:hypothetical protein
MEEHRELMKKMIDESRETADERRNTMLLKMYQTNTSPASADIT